MFLLILYLILILIFFPPFFPILFLTSNTGFAFSSGLAATTTITHLLNAGDHIVSMNDVYGGTNRYFSKVASRFGITTTFVDCSNVELLEKAIQPNTKVNSHIYILSYRNIIILIEKEKSNNLKILKLTKF